MCLNLVNLLHFLKQDRMLNKPSPLRILQYVPAESLYDLKPLTFEQRNNSMLFC